MLSTQRTWPQRAGAARGAVLVLVLFMLALFSVIAGIWALRATLQLAHADEYVDALAARTAADTALEHAKAAMGAMRLLPAEAASTWILLSSSRTDVTEYRVTLRDTAQMPERALPWPASEARRASPVVLTADGWRRVLDPHAASHDELRNVCAAALRQCSGDERYAASLALTLADAFDDNMALATHADGTMGYEGLSLVGVLHGDDRIFPVAQIVRQSTFYDVDYQRDNFAIFGAFTIDAVEPVAVSATRTNTRIRLSERLLDPVRQQHWDAFQRLWYRVYSTRFIPHAWRGQSALIVTECGGASTRFTILDNDGEWLYFEGYPHAACLRGRFVSIKLCSLRARPGCLTAEARGAPDVWFLTGLCDRAAYRLAWYGEGARVAPKLKLVYGEAAQSVGTELVRAAEGVVGFEVTLTRDLRISALRASQPEVVAWRYTGAQPLQIGGWRWERQMPEALVDGLVAWSNAPAPALVLPGTLWYWCSEGAYAADKDAVVSFVPRDESGLAYAVDHVALTPSPHGGWAWQVRARVHRRHPWVAGQWRGGMCVRACDSNAPARAAFLILDNHADTLLVHVGTRATAETLAPAPGSWVRLGGLAQSVRRPEHRLITPLGQVAAREAPAEVRLALNTWLSRSHGQWQARPPETVFVATNQHASSVRVALSPVWQEIRTAVRDPDEFAATLDTWVKPLGIELPVNAHTAPVNWTPTCVLLRRVGAARWHLPRSYARWPQDFWRGAEVIFHNSGDRARVVRSHGTTLELDHPVRSNARATATLAPVAGVVFHVTAAEPAEGTWEWPLPPDLSMPCTLYVRGFCPPDTTTAARLHVAVWNARREAFDVLAQDASFSQQDVLCAGVVDDDHRVGGHVLRVRIRAEGGPAWVRGGYLVPTAWSGRPERQLGDLLSDAVCAEITARVRRNGAVLAECQATALLQRHWVGPSDHLTPIVRCARLQWHALAMPPPALGNGTH